MASTALLADIALAKTYAITATTALAAANAPAGPIMHLEGNLQLVELKFQEARVLLQEIDKVTSAAGGDDSNLQTKITDLLGALV